jgi:pilus assembly protein Flp/PilA
MFQSLRHACGLLQARYTKTERGASLIEYAFLVGLIAMVCIAAVTYFGGQTSHKFSNIGSSIS